MQNETVQALSLPLYSAKGWLKFLAVMSIIGGIFSALSIVGLLVAWIPIWQGVLLFQAAGAIEQAYLSGNQEQMLLAQNKVKTYFIIMAVLLLISVVLGVLGAGLGIVAGIAAFSA